MKVAACPSVLVVHIPANNCAKPLNIEERILNFERVKGSLDQVDPTRKCIVSLLQFQFSAETSISILWHDAEPVAMQISSTAWLKARYAQANRDHFATVERAEYLATDFARYNEQAQR